MVTCSLQGGIGNLLFEISTTISYALDNDDQTLFDIDNHKIGLQGNNAIKYKDNIFSKLNNNTFKTDIYYNEPYFHYKEIKIDLNVDKNKVLCLNGYFQSEKYFINNKDVIIDIFSPNDNDKLFLSNILNKYRNNEKELVSLHIRRGDYLKFPTIHPFIGMDYINKSISLFDDYNILVFSDDIKWCNDNIQKENVFYLNNDIKLEDYQELWLMSLCDHNIISNSSFSWWGSYLNKNENKIVVAPKIWFGTDSDNDSKDIYTKEMIKI
jgi:hypothetical protein